MTEIAQPANRPERRIEVSGVKIDLVRFGRGPALLFLHSVNGIDPEQPFLVRLGRRFDVVAPWHPGFGHSELPRHFRSIGDLAYFYLDLLFQLELTQVIVVGTSFGGWLACELAVRDCSRLAGVVLLDPLGIKVGDREIRDIADMHAASQEELTRLAYHRPEHRRRDYSTMSEWELYAIARSREAYTLFGWSPYMHNPQLKHWLKRISCPTLVLSGASDRITAPEYAKAFADLIPGANCVVIPEAGHYPHIENPDATLAAIESFLATRPVTPA